MNVGTIIEFIESMIKSTRISNAEGAYGGGMSGAPFDPLSFIKKPQVILRIVTLLFAVIVFGCIAAEDTYQSGTCPFNEDGTACGLGITIGVLAFLGCIAFLIIDARFDNFSNIKTRKRAVIVDLAFSGFMAFIWFITFCYLANEWRKTGLENVGVHKVQASIAFSFFSIITWAMMCLLNYLRYRQGISPAFTSGGYEEHNQADNQNFEAPYSNQMTNSSSSYQQQPTY